MSGQGFQCVSDGEEEAEDLILSPLLNDQGQGSNVNGTVRKNLLDDFGPAIIKRSVADQEPPGREHMKVYLRVRPFMESELAASEDQRCVEIENEKAVVMHAPRDSFAFKNSSRGVGETTHRFTFSRVFDSQTSQKTFFDDTTLGMIKDFVDGQNCLVFTYGVTNSGKTYTIQGSPRDGGILPRSLDVLFNSIDGKQYKRTNLKPRYFCDVMRLDAKQEHNEDLVKKAFMQSLDKGSIDLSALLKLEESDLSKASSFEESSLQSNQGENEVDHSAITADSENTESDEHRIADDTTISVDAQGPVNFSIWVSFAEIYNEQIFDLLDPCPTGKGKKRNTLRLGDDKNGNPYIKGLREVCVHSADEAYKILKVGQKNQRISATKLNQCSSRSHCIFSVKVLRVVEVEDPHVARVSRLSFVDLAGSERYTKTQSKGDRLKEAGNINTSLMTLGKCLDYLRYNQNNPSHPLIIPFRESKLTRLFQGTFCGKGKACMVVNVNQCASMYDETCHVMKFSAIAKQVTTKITKPVDLMPPTKKVRTSSLLTTPSKGGRGSVAWADGSLHTPVPKKFAAVPEEDEEAIDDDLEGGNSDLYQQQLIALIKALQDKLIEEKRSKIKLEMKIREEVCAEMAEQLVAIETAYSDRMYDEVMAVEEKCDRRIELLTQSVQKCRKRARVQVDRIEDDEEEWVSSVLLHAEQTRVKEKDHLIQELNAKVAKLKQELKQEKEANKESLEDSEIVIELQARLNEANNQIALQNAQNAKLQQTLDDAGEAFAEKESEILKLRKALEDDENLRKEQDQVLTELRENVSNSVVKIKELESRVAEKGNKLVKSQEEIKTLEASLEEAVLEDSDRSRNQNEEIARLKKAVEDKEIEVKDVRELLVAKDEQIRKLESNIRDHSAALNDHETFVETLNSQVKQLSKELEEAKCTVGSPMKSAATNTPSQEHTDNPNALGDASVKLKELERKLENKDTLMKDLVQALEETRASLAKEKDNCSKSVQEIRKEKSEVQEKLVELEHQCSELQKQFKCKEEAMIVLRESELKARMEGGNVINEEKLAVQEREDLKRRLNEAETKNGELEEVISRSKESLVESAQEKELKLEKEKRLKSETANLQEMLLETKHINEELLKSKQDLTETLQNARVENEKLQMKENKLFSEKEKQQESLQIAERTMKDLEELVKVNETRLASMEKEKSTVEHEREMESELKCEKLKLEELLQTAEAKRKELECIVKSKDEMLGNLEEARDEAVREKERSITRENKLNKDKQRIGELMLAAEIKCKELERTVREKERLALEETRTETQREEKANTADSNCSVIATLQKQLEEATKALDKKNAQLIARNNNVKRLELTLEEARIEVEKLREETKTRGSQEQAEEGKKMKKAEEMQAVIDKQKDEIRNLEEKAVAFDNQRREMKLLEEKLSKFDNQREEIRKLEEKAIEFEKLRENLREKSAKFEKQREDVKKELDEKSTELEEVRVQLTDTNNFVRSRNTQIEQLESKLGKTRDFERSIDILRSELQLARDHGKRVEQKLEEAEKEKVQLSEMNKARALDAEKQSKAFDHFKKVVNENEIVLNEQEEALEIRQMEMESLTTELNAEHDRCDALAKEIEKKGAQLEKMKEEVDFLTEENTKFEKEQCAELSELKKEKTGLLGRIEVQRCTIEQLKSEQQNTDRWGAKEKDLLEGEINEKDEKIKKLRDQVKKVEKEKEDVEDVLDEKERVLKKTEEQKEKTVKAMREALEIAKSKKTEYEANLQETREQCEKELIEKYEKVTQKLRSDFHRKVEEMDKVLKEVLEQKGRIEHEKRVTLDSLHQIESEFKMAAKCKEFEEELSGRQSTIERLEKQVAELASHSGKQANKDICKSEEVPKSARKNLKRKSSNLTLAEIKKQMVKQRKTSQDSDEEFTPGSSRRSTRSCRRATRLQQASSPIKLALSPMKENEMGSVKKVRFMGKLVEQTDNSGSPGSHPNEQPSVTNTAKKLMHSKPQTPKQQENTPAAKPSTARKGRGKLMQLNISETFAASPNVQLTMDPPGKTPRRNNIKDILSRTLRSRTVKSTK